MIEAVCADQSCLLLPGVGEGQEDLIWTDHAMASTLSQPPTNRLLPSCSGDTRI